MENQKMTIHRALAELKLIDSKIMKSLDSLELLGVKKKNGLVNDAYDVEKFKSLSVSSYQKTTDLIQRKHKIKTAIMNSNSKTFVKVGENKITVSDAIFMKDNIDLKVNFLEKMKQQKERSKNHLLAFNTDIENNAFILAEQAMGKDNVKVTNEDVLAITEPYKDKNKIFLVDPLDISKKIEDLQNEIDNFTLNVDAVLSESNAITVIEI